LKEKNETQRGSRSVKGRKESPGSGGEWGRKWGARGGRGGGLGGGTRFLIKGKEGRKSNPQDPHPVITLEEGCGRKGFVGKEIGGEGKKRRDRTVRRKRRIALAVPGNSTTPRRGEGERKELLKKGKKGKKIRKRKGRGTACSVFENPPAWPKPKRKGLRKKKRDAPTKKKGRGIEGQLSPPDKAEASASSWKKQS